MPHDGKHSDLWDMLQLVQIGDDHSFFLALLAASAGVSSVTMSPSFKPLVTTISSSLRRPTSIGTSLKLLPVCRYAAGLPSLSKLARMGMSSFLGSRSMITSAPALLNPARRLPW